MMMKPPKRALIDSFEYEEYTGSDDWNQPTYKPSILIKYARIERQTQYTNSANGKDVLYNALIFCYEGITEPLTAFKEQSRVVIDGQARIITNVTTNYEPYEPTVYSYEIEVI